MPDKNTNNILSHWTRIEFDSCPIYVNGEKPDWFVPNSAADSILRQCGADDKTALHTCAIESSHSYDIARIISQLSAPLPAPYRGRAAYLKPTQLKECWFHLTHACNLACRHCLFAASPAQDISLKREELAAGIAQAKSLGCTLFYFTGGEPFIYPDFPAILSELLEDQAIHAVVLTNGLLIQDHISDLKKLSADRLHLQISMDGMEESHDKIRGKGMFTRLQHNLDCLRAADISVTLSMALNRDNLFDLQDIIGFAALKGISNIHLLYHFVRGKGSSSQFVPPTELFSHLAAAQHKAEDLGVTIDNFEIIKSQIFSSPGTRYDLSNTAWESIAVGPDGHIYPSPALVGISELDCGPLAAGLENIWHTSRVLQDIRSTSLKDSLYRENPLKFLIGGGDIDHSYIHSQKFSGHDPYLELYNLMALWLIKQQAKRYMHGDKADIVLKMGDVRHDCPDGGQEVSLTHCNCVLSLSGDRGHSSVREFYAGAATQENTDIVNPFAPQQAEAKFIPTVSKSRSYGCGSPVSDAGLEKGDIIVDLGSGSGVECFQAAKAVGPDGRVFGIDMTDEMLSLARSSQAKVANQLGYDNIEFRKGFLEEIPLPDETSHVVISNCVINLSPDKRQTLHEAFRILKPGGRLVVSDIVTDEPVPLSIKNNEKFRGECLGGAMDQEDLIAMLRAVGFTSILLIKRFPYRQVNATSFYSLTFSAVKPAVDSLVDVIYRGPFGAVYSENGTLLLKGKKTSLTNAEALTLGDAVFIVNKTGSVTNIEQEDSCCSFPAKSEENDDSCCCQASETAPLSVQPLSCCSPDLKPVRHQSDCLVCKSPLTYLTQEEEMCCHYCGTKVSSNARCRKHHFVCDTCHQEEGLAVIRQICAESDEQDMIRLLQKIRTHHAINMHGPEHHAMVPGIILSTYKALGGKISREDILTGISRGSKVPGGACGFWGSCGAALGAGIAFSVIFGSTPLTPKKRQQAQSICARILTRVSAQAGARCCQRDAVVALKEAAKLSRDLLPVSLKADDLLPCRQYLLNRECIRKQCPLWESRDKTISAQTAQLPMAS
jgi:MoaA/NifB/PqqE/SkfB family radical SAM enzyme/ubiquinone/menaquinone biosynthesis C-methylase UbiE